jgi:hypothetical protein
MGSQLWETEVKPNLTWPIKIDYALLAALVVILMPVRIEKVFADSSAWEIAGLVGYVAILIRVVEVWRWLNWVNERMKE